MSGADWALGGSSFLFGLVSGAVPILNSEVWMVATAAASAAPIWMLALTLALGQSLGKLPYLLAGAGVERFADRRAERQGESRWHARLERLSAWCERHPAGLLAVTFAAAAVSLPPFALWCVAAGGLGMKWHVFLVVSTAGRFVRFLLLGLFPGLLPGDLG